jgi:uncharacterized protein (TIGR02391 family)
MLFLDYLQSQFPNPDDVVTLSTEELAGIILEYAQTGAADSRRVLNAFDLPWRGPVTPYPVEYTQPIVEAVTLARVWLVNEQLIMWPAVGQQVGSFGLTQRGRQAKARGLNAFRQSKLLDRGFLHPKIAERAWDHFRHGRYDDAIGAAFKEIEVAVRQAGGFPPETLGTDMMYKAFNPDSGKLYDSSAVDLGSAKSEQNAFANLFAGAIGVYKNPHSHRWVGNSDPVEVVEVLVLASHLYRLLERRVAALGLSSP